MRCCKRRRENAKSEEPDSSLFSWILFLFNDQCFIKERQAERAGAGVGANDAADLAGQGLGTVQIILQVGLDGGHLAGGDGVACQRGQRGVDAAQLFDLFEEAT